MRLAVKVFVGLVIVGVLAAGLLPPLFAQAHLRDDASAAAQAGAAQMLNVQAGMHASVTQAVAASLATHEGLKLVSTDVNAGVVTVRVTKNVHTFMSGLPGFEHWFNPTVTARASEYGPHS